MTDNNQKHHKKTIIIACAIIVLLFVLSFILPLRKSGCLSPCRHSNEPGMVCADVCVYARYNIWGMELSEGYN